MRHTRIMREAPCLLQHDLALLLMATPLASFLCLFPLPPSPPFCRRSISRHVPSPSYTYLLHCLLALLPKDKKPSLHLPSKEKELSAWWSNFGLISPPSPHTRTHILLAQHEAGSTSCCLVGHVLILLFLPPLAERLDYLGGDRERGEEPRMGSLFL